MEELNALAEEMTYQQALDDYKMSYNFAMALCNWANSQTRNRRYRAEDFIGEYPQRREKYGGTQLS